MNYITRIVITGLNGRKTVSIQIPRRHCVIVGPNGSGKSTALQVIAYALGRQWKDLASLRFDTVTFFFASGISTTISRSSSEAYLQARGFSPRTARLQKMLTEMDLIDGFIASSPTEDTFAAYATATATDSRDLRQLHRILRTTKSTKAVQKEVADFQNALRQSAIPSTLYLPTYRRIELELGRVVEGIPEYYRRQINTEMTPGVTNEFITELIRFGMTDVKQLLSSFETKTRDYARNRFNRMMTSYLKEMANAKSLSVRNLRAMNIDEKTIESVLSRIEEGLLSPTEKEKIANIILELTGQQATGNPPFNKKWLAHFFVRLLEVSREIEERELPIRSLTSTLGKYLHPKEVRYDTETYSFSIYGEDQQPLPLPALSSGEKQLVSLLSQLHLTEKSFNVLIDEPELSLSVPWQYDLLPDLAASPACNQVIAVTHSPFIYDNALGNSVVDFIEAGAEAE